MSKVTGTWREKIQYTTACLAFLSGQILTWVQYLQQGEISTGVLGFVAQTLVYSASIYGVSIYIQGKFGQIISKIKNNYKTLLNAICGLLIAFCLASGIFYHNKANRLSEELKMANNNIEAYQDALSGAQQASGVLRLDMKKLKDYNDKLVQQLDSVRKVEKLKSKEIQVAATQKQIINVNKSKGVGGDIMTILKDSVYKDSLQYNDLTKVYYTIGKDSVNIKLDVQNTQYLYIYKHREYKNKKNFFKRLITFDWKKKDVYKYRIHNTNDILKEDSIRIIEAI